MKYKTSVLITRRFKRRVIINLGKIFIVLNREGALKLQSVDLIPVIELLLSGNNFKKKYSKGNLDTDYYFILYCVNLCLFIP